MKNPETLEDATALIAEISKAGGLRLYSRQIERPASTVQRWANKAEKIVNKDYRPRSCMTRRDNKLKALIEYMGGCCELCKKEFPPCAYDFHHKNPAEKDFSISKILGNDLEAIKAEANKCALLCSNCHRIAHFVESRLFKT